jgi:hypothetical protein
LDAATANGGADREADAATLNAGAGAHRDHQAVQDGPA